MAKRTKQDGRLINVQDLVQEVWNNSKIRFAYMRQDFENLERSVAKGFLKKLSECSDPCLEKFSWKGKQSEKDFIYTGEGFRFMISLSGTESIGATIRLYLEKSVTSDFDK